MKFVVVAVHGDFSINLSPRPARPLESRRQETQMLRKIAIPLILATTFAITTTACDKGQP